MDIEYFFMTLLKSDPIMMKVLYFLVVGLSGFGQRAGSKHDNVKPRILIQEITPNSFSFF